MISRKYFLILSLCLLSFSCSSAERFEKGEFECEDFTIPYRFAHFNQNKTDALLFVFLHGKSACGTDNDAQLTKDSLIHAVDYIKSRTLNAFVLAPQCTEERQWGKINSEVKSLIEDFCRKNNIKSENILLCGESMGGGGVWTLINRHPDFARRAVAIASSAPINADYKRLAKTPLYSVLGDVDKIGDPKKVKPVIERLQEMGCEAKIKILENHDHEPTCADGLSEDVLDWLFAD